MPFYPLILETFHSGVLISSSRACGFAGTCQDERSQPQRGHALRLLRQLGRRVAPLPADLPNRQVWLEPFHQLLQRRQRHRHSGLSESVLPLYDVIVTIPSVPFTWKLALVAPIRIPSICLGPFRVLAFDTGTGVSKNNCLSLALGWTADDSHHLFIGYSSCCYPPPPSLQWWLPIRAWTCKPEGALACKESRGFDSRCQFFTCEISVKCLPSYPHCMTWNCTLWMFPACIWEMYPEFNK